MPSKLKQNYSILKSVAIALLVFIPMHKVSAAENQIALQLSNTRTVMQQLDQIAGLCIDSEQPASSSQNTSQNMPCEEFREALNGEALETYIDNCRTIKTWRDQFVSSQSDNAAPVVDTDESLELMIAAEFLCGEDALLKRTEFIALAYQQLNNTNRPGLPLVGGTSRQLREFRQDLLISRERERLMDTFQQQQLRQQQETQRQIDRQELEFIRQQNIPQNRR